MKKVLKIILIATIAIITALSMVACSTPGDPQTKTGLLYKKESGTGVFVITGYKDDGTEKDTLTIDVSEAEELIRIKKGAFSGNDTIKHLIISGDVDEIEAGAFQNMVALETLEVPFIGQYANADATFGESGEGEKKATGAASTLSHFFGSAEYYKGTTAVIKHLESGSEVETTCYVPVTLNKIVVNAPTEYSIPMDAFNGFKGGAQTLTIELNENVKAIGERAFKDTSISQIKIPASVKTIYKNAFENCALLNTVEFADGASNIVVGENAFEGCVKMNSVDSAIDLTVNFEKFSSVDEGAFDFGREGVKYSVTNEGSFNLSVIFGLTSFTSLMPM